MATDVVCKMTVDEKQAKTFIVYRRKIYYFCSIGCRAEFERHPEEYAAEVAEAPNRVKSHV